MSGMSPSSDAPIGVRSRAAGPAPPLEFRQSALLHWPTLGVSAAATVFIVLGGLSAVLSGSATATPWVDGATITWSVTSFLLAILCAAIYSVYQKVSSYRLRHRLFEAEKLFSLIGDSGSDLIAIVDTEGRRLYNSPSYEKLLGYSQEDLKNTFGLEQIHPDDRANVIAAANEAKRTGSGRRLEYRIRHRDGSWRIFESTCSAVRDHSGKIDKLIIINRDITAQREQAREILRQKEEQLRQTQKMEAIGRLSGGVAHDFNNLLSVIIGYAEDLEQNLDPSGRLRKEAEEVRKAGERAASLTRQLLAFSRQQALQPQVLDLNKIVADLARMLRRLVGSDIEFAVELDPLTGRIKADQGQIEQVMMNLVVNARDAMPEGGRLTVSTRNFDLHPSDAAQIPGAEAGMYVELSVADTGIGMNAETLSHIFEPFFTTKAEGKGTGLGLATVAGIIQQSGGHVLASSRPGNGSCFRILLPRTAESVAETVLKVRPTVPSASRNTILVVEDDGALRELVDEMLSRNGYRVLTAATPVIAQRIAREFEGTIDLLLSDIVLPGMKGPLLAQSIIEVCPGIRVLYMSGYSDVDPKSRQSLPAGSPFLRKPFTTDTLLLAVGEAIAPAVTEPVH
jgi:two-component system cell cycle sensor histidine kinase/response regulator CckA